MRFHFSLMNPLLPDARPWDTGLLIVVAGLVVCRDRGAMLGGRDAVVDVIPGDRRTGGAA